MKCLFRPQYLVEPQYIEGYFDGMWIVLRFLSSGENCVSYGLKASIPVKNLKCSLTGRKTLNAKKNIF